MKIGPVDLKIIGLREIIKTKKEINASRTRSTRDMQAACAE